MVLQNDMDQTRERPHRRVLATLLTMMLIVTLTPAIGAQAIESTVSLSIVASGCGTATWKGAISNSYTKGYWPTYRAEQSYGSVRYCTTKLRAADDNPNADYYLVEASSAWERTRDSSFHSGAPWTTSVRSSRSAIQNEYSGTPSFSKSTCEVRFSIGLRIAGISLASPQHLRCGTRISRDYLTISSAKWTGVDSSKIRTTSLIYAQAVKEGATPTFTVSYTRPNYQYSWSRVRQCRGSCWYSWVPRSTQTGASVTYTR